MAVSNYCDRFAPDPNMTLPSLIIDIEHLNHLMAQLTNASI